jgi:hypothetical protein
MRPEENFDNDFGPTLHMEYENSFGDRTELCISLMDETADAMVDGFRRFMLACGFAVGTVNDVLGEEL